MKDAEGVGAPILLNLLDEFIAVPDQRPYGLPGSDNLRRIVPMRPGIAVALGCAGCR